MAQDASKVRVALKGHIWLQDEDGVEPQDVMTTPANAIDLGFTSDDGVTFTIGRETEDIPGWPSRDPLRRLVTAEPKTAAFVLRQVDNATITTSLGGTIVELPSGTYRWEPDEGVIATKKLYIDFEDGYLDDGVTPLRYRFGFRRTQNLAQVEFQLVNNAAVDLPNEWSALAVGGGKKTWFIDSNDPAMSPGGAAKPE